MADDKLSIRTLIDRLLDALVRLIRSILAPSSESPAPGSQPQPTQPGFDSRPPNQPRYDAPEPDRSVADSPSPYQPTLGDQEPVPQVPILKFSVQKGVAMRYQIKGKVIDRRKRKYI